MLNVEIIVEIGTDEQKKLITTELEAVTTAVKNYPDLRLYKIIIPSDFDATVNKLQDTTNFSSLRGHLTIGKNIKYKDGTAIVFSPFIYTDAHDSNSRCFLYMHEIMHVI